jgi:hypothetical protein
MMPIGPAAAFVLRAPALAPAAIVGLTHRLSQIDVLNFTAGIATKLALGLKDGSTISWMPGVIDVFGVKAIFQ